uniref:phospholipid-hydroperoxide glutathione peroxidase n=1 Tax=Apteryx owenii TaxID=8824 RepID=A0A8B9Q770_APTOW
WERCGGGRLWKPKLCLGCSSTDDWRTAKSIYDFHAQDIDGKTDVNYTQFVDLYARYAERGLRILAFPCNQFGKQEPGDNAQIKAFAEKYGVKFDMFSKINVNGDNALPLWTWMKAQPAGRGTLGNMSSNTAQPWCSPGTLALLGPCSGSH